MDTTREEHYGKIILTNWNWGYGKLDEEISKVISETLEEAFTDDPPYITMPIYWGPESDGHGKPPVSDPLTLYIHLPALDVERDMGPTWSITVGDLIKNTLEEAEPELAAQIKQALHALADSITSPSSGISEEP